MKKTLLLLAAVGLSFTASAQFNNLISNQGYEKSVEFNMNSNPFMAQAYRLISKENTTGIGAIPTLDFQFKKDGLWANTLSLRNDRVGIGATNPLAALDVRGTIRIPMATNVNNNSHGLIGAAGDFLYGGKYVNNLGVGFYSPITFGGTPGTPPKRNSYISGFDGVDLFTDSQLRMRVSENGNVGIGTAFPLRTFHVDGQSYFDGNVGIGSKNPDATLTVRGDIHAQEVKVDLNVPADYVFQKYFTGTSSLMAGYSMPTLEEVEQFAKSNYHLPNIPSAKNIQENGLELGEMTNLLLQKIEELTLYTIEQEHRIKVLEKKLSN